MERRMKIKLQKIPDMNINTIPSAEELVGTLNALDVPFLSGGIKSTQKIVPAQLIAGLAMQPDARLRLALIPLLLSRPDLAPTAVLEANSYLSGVAAFNLKLFYTAALLLQETYQSKLDELLGQRQTLPNLFGEKLAIAPTGSAETRLRELGERHKALIGVRANWVGTYHHGAKRLIKRLECEIQWGLR